MTWGFIWLMFVLKIPIFMLFGIVWWAVRRTDEPAVPPADDVKVRPKRPHPRSRVRRPRRPRGPHGGVVALPPPRVRSVVAISRGRERPGAR
jgi:hypothetical protein